MNYKPKHGSAYNTMFTSGMCFLSNFLYISYRSESSYSRNYSTYSNYSTSSMNLGTSYLFFPNLLFFAKPHTSGAPFLSSSCFSSSICKAFPLSVFIISTFFLEEGSAFWGKWMGLLCESFSPWEEIMETISDSGLSGSLLMASEGKFCDYAFGPNN